MIKSICIKKLFGIFDYNLDLKKDINIITAPNGYGKTTILRIIHDILDDDLYDLSKIIFQEIKLTNDQDCSLFIKKDDNGFFINNEPVSIPLSVDATYEGKIRLSYKNDTFDSIPSTIYINPKEDKVEITFENRDFTGIMFRDNVIIGDVKRKGGVEKTSYVKDMALFYLGVGNAFFLESDRLLDKSFYDKKYTRFNSSIVDTSEIDIDYITKIPDKIIKHMNDYVDLYANKSALFDTSFLNKLSREIKELGGETIYKEKNYASDLALINDRLGVIKEYGLLSDKDFPKLKSFFSEDYKLVFKIFAENYLRKLDVFKPLLDKLNLFKEIINGKLLHKNIVLDKRSGLTVNTDGDEKRKISLKALSSGEKEIIVMYFKLLFESDPDYSCSIYLIDEPEISLHVEWQSKILDDLQNILNLGDGNKQIIICTHSPQVIGERWRDVIELAYQNKVEE